jgi:hypothetical protein
LSSGQKLALAFVSYSHEAITDTTIPPTPPDTTNGSPRPSLGRSHGVS